MPLLTPGEYDDLPQNIKDELAGVMMQTYKDTKDTSYRKKKGPFMNGELYADPRPSVKVGFGTGDPRAPHPPAES